MAEIKRRDLIVGAGALAAAGGAAVAATSSGSSSKPLQIDVTTGTPTLPKDHVPYSFPLASAKPTATTPGGTVTELTEKNFPIFKGDDIGLSTMFGGMPTNTFSQTLGVPAGTLDGARKSPKTLLIVQRRG